jgi:hypothetical protein
MFATARTAGRTLALVMVLLGVATQAFAGSPQQTRANALPEALRHTGPLAGVEPVNFTAEAVPVGRHILPSAAPRTAPVVTAAAHQQIVALTDPKVLHSLPGGPFAAIFASVKPIAAPLDSQVRNTPTPVLVTPTPVLVASARN